MIIKIVTSVLYFCCTHSTPYIYIYIYLHNIIVYTTKLLQVFKKATVLLVISVPRSPRHRAFSCMYSCTQIKAQNESFDWFTQTLHILCSQTSVSHLSVPNITTTTVNYLKLYMYCKTSQ